jgi:hypothetical protein
MDSVSLCIIVCFVVGMGGGYLLRGRKSLLDLCGKLITVSLWVLLLVLGLWVGTDPEIMGNLHRSALLAAGIALATMIGSIAVSYPVYRFMFHKRLRMRPDPKAGDVLGQQPQESAGKGSL